MPLSDRTGLVRFKCAEGSASGAAKSLNERHHQRTARADRNRRQGLPVGQGCLCQIGQDWFASNAPKEAPAGPPNPSMNATISAPPAPTGIGGKVSQWAKDASGDIRYGGDKTVVGRALHAVG